MGHLAERSLLSPGTQTGPLKDNLLFPLCLGPACLPLHHLSIVAFEDLFRLINISVNENAPR